MLRPRPLAGPGRNIGSRYICWSSAAGALYLAIIRRSLPSRKISDADSASQRRVAFLSMDWNTGSSSPGELEITLKTSEVAVCCPSASLRSSVRWRSSLSRRVFSMAMTAWFAKFVTSSICLSVNGRNLLTEDTERANELVSLEHRHTNCCALAAEFNGCHAIRVPLKIGAVAANIGNLDGLLRTRDSTQKSVWSPNALLAAVLL